jgi:hypothetical protein
MTEYIFKYDKLLPLPEVVKPEKEHHKYWSKWKGYVPCFSEVQFNRDFEIFNNWLSTGIDLSEELKLEVDKVYRDGLDFEVKEYMTREHGLKEMGFEIDGLTGKSIILPEKKTFLLAIPVSTANETAILSEKSLAKDWDKEDDKKWEGFLWTDKKPAFDREMVFVTANEFKDVWEYNVWQILQAEGEDDKGNTVWYWALCNSEGDEWGDNEDLAADKYLILPSLKTKKMENKNEGGHYYDLFKFFNEQHNLLLLDSEIQDIIHVVESFQQNKEGEEDNADHWKGEAEHWYSEAHRLQKIIDESNDVPVEQELLYTENQLFTMATNVAEWATTNHKEAGKQSMPEWREFYKKYFLNGFKKNIEYLKKLNSKTKAP